MAAGAKAKCKLVSTKERDSICTDEFLGRELSQAPQSSELLTCIQEL